MAHGNGGDKGEALGEPFGTAHSHKNSTCCLAGRRLPLGHALFLHTFAHHCALPLVITTHSVPTKHQIYSGSCKEVSSSLATAMRWEISWGVPTGMSTCVSSMSAQRSMQVSRGYPRVRSVTAVCFPADNTARATPAHFLLYLSNTPQVVQERRRRRLGSW